VGAWRQIIGGVHQKAQWISILIATPPPTRELARWVKNPEKNEGFWSVQLQLAEREEVSWHHHTRRKKKL
jgi:hypothetical protein